MTSNAESGAPAPQVSIIVPVYNVEDYLRRCLNSIERQTLKEWECICVDDGSPDGSGAILDEYAARDARFVVIHQENGGVSRARNAGIEAARAEYIGFVDPDDWIEPDMFEAALDAARRTGADLVRWASIHEREDGSFPTEALKEGFFDVAQSPEYYSGWTWSNLVKSSLVLKNNIRFPTDVSFWEDTNFFIVAYALAKRCYYIDRALYHYDRTRTASTLHNITKEMRAESAEARKKTYARIEEICGTGGGG